MKQLLTIAMVALVAIVLNGVLCTGSAQAQGWPEVFDPNQFLTLNIETINPADWDTIRYDTTSDIEVPALFWADGEEANKLYVSVRRKSCRALPSEADPCKVSLKIDINEYISGQKWHSLNKLSLENGDDEDVLSEGLACNIHRMACGPEGYGYDAWYANWVKVYVNGVYRGVYVNNEQIDKQFLRNRGLYLKNQVWLYKITGDNKLELTVGDEINPASPALLALCYVPFVCTDCGDLTPPGGVCPTPDDANLIADVNNRVNMQGLLAMTAADAFAANSDSLFVNNHNASFLDFIDGRKRMYFPWDVDDILQNTNFNIYGTGTDWQLVFLGNPTFRSQYNQILRDLINGPLSEANIHAFLNMIEPIMTDALAADPYNQFATPGVAGVQQHFDYIRDWISDRIANVRDQVDFDEPLPPPGIILLQDGFEGEPWDANWSENWQQDNTIYAHGSASAWANELNNGDFTCNALDTSGATAIHIDFWFMKEGTDEAEDFLLYYYDGTNYNFIADLDTLGDDNVWLHYTDMRTDSNYFVPNFRISFNGTPETGENVWVDDVVVTFVEQVPPVISGYIVDSIDIPIEDVLVSADNGGGSDLTDPNGYYEVTVDYDWSGTVTPAKAGYTFEPPNRTYANATADQPNQDYTAILLTYTISGTVTSSGSGLAGVVMNGLPDNPITDANGTYSATVGYGFSGTATPTMAGYTFTPAQRIYSNVTTVQINQDYTATLLTYTISGTVTSGGSGFAGVVMNGLPDNPITDANGTYSATVGYGFSGTATPTMAGYSFTPAQRIYSNVTTVQTNQDYTAIPLTYTISGTVTSGGSALAGVVMNGLPGNPNTNASGYYGATVSYGFSGTVTPTKEGYTFTPAGRVYSNVTTDQTNQDYTAILLTYTISGTVTSGGSGLAGVVMNGLPDNPITDANGTYSATVGYDFSGTATPTMAGYIFTPAQRVYSNVTTDQTNQDYTGTLSTMYHTISGTVTSDGSGLSDVVMNGLPGNPNTNASGYYIATVEHSWSGTVTPTKAGYTFEPLERTYSNVTADQLNQDYTATVQSPTEIVLLGDGFEGEPWDANWNDNGVTKWSRQSIEKHSGIYSAYARNNKEGTFTSDDLDASDANAITVDFWFRKKGTEPTGFTLYYYNASSYGAPVAELDGLGGEKQWLHYTDVITDSQYFVANFRLRFDATLSRGVEVWVDDVVVTKKIFTECDLANLDAIFPVNFGDFAILADDWQLTGPDLAGDTNQDLVVNFEDLAQIVRHWLGDCR